MAKKKLHQISFLFVFATLLVVIGHSDITMDFRELWVYKWVYTFHMPLFFLVSGFLFAYTNPKEKMLELNKVRFLQKKVKRLLLPYVFISSVIFVIKALFIKSDQMQHPLTFEWDSYLNMLFFHPVGFMWFLPTLFVIFVIFVSIYYLKWNKYLQMGGVILCFLLGAIVPDIPFFKISSAVYFSGYFALGIVYCTYKEQVDNFLKRFRWFILPVSFLLSAMLIDIALIAALIGILFSLSLSLTVESRCGKRVVTLSNYTYTVFLLSYFPQMFIRGPVAHAIPDVNQYVLSAISFVTGFCIPVLIGALVVRLKKRNKFIDSCALLIGL